MRAAVIGASGRTGRATVRYALAAGLDVVSVVRSPSSAPEGTTAAQADARDREALAAGVKGDAVVSCLGHVASDQDPTVLQDGATALAAAMASAGVPRLVAVSAAGATFGTCIG
jgi:putative NADH-flavin reductase